MPRLVCRKGIYQVEFFDPAKGFTTRQSLGTDDAGLANRKYAEWILANSDEKGSVETTLEELVGKFYSRQGKNYASKYVYKTALAYVSKYLPGVKLGEFKRFRQERFVSDLRAEGLADGSIKRIVSVVATSVNYAYQNDLIPIKPHILTVQDHSSRDRPLTDDEVRAILSACERTSDLRYIQIALLTGARPSAILGLQKSQFDFAHHLLRLLPPGERQIKQKPKPTIPLPKALEVIAETWEDGFVVQTDHGNRFQDHRRIWERVSKNLPDDIVCYDLRHTVATELRRQGVPEWDISGYLGHTGPGSKTTGRYAHYRPAFMREAADAMDRFWGRINATRTGMGSETVGDPGAGSAEGRQAA